MIAVPECPHQWFEEGGEVFCLKCGTVSVEPAVDRHSPAKSGGNAVLPTDHHSDDKNLIKRIQQNADYLQVELDKIEAPRMRSLCEHCQGAGCTKCSNTGFGRIPKGKEVVKVEDVGKEGRVLSLHDLFDGEPSLVADLRDEAREKLREVGIPAGVVESQLKRVDRKIKQLEQEFEVEVKGVYQPLFNEYLRRKILFGLRPKGEKHR
jgi:hypothetical protein